MTTKRALSPRQAVIMQRLIDGKTLKEIADELGIKAKTVQHHTVRAREKLFARTLYECVAIVVRDGILAQES